MNLVLAHCGKEWRAQRGTLVAYTLLVFACLCLGLSLLPKSAWSGAGFGAQALSWFVMAGMVGVVGFVAPALVRAEFGPKDDQFVRRLPGALWPSFHGKLLFLVLATVSMPLLGLLAGEGYLLACGEGWTGLVWEVDGGTRVHWPYGVVGTACALLLVPWIWAIGSWLPGGRMAIGGTGLLLLVAGVCVAAVLRQSPGIEKGMHWQVWLWAVAPVGLAVAAVSWAIGRRGGGPLRSARFGLASAAVGLVPPSLWFADRAGDFHHPDLHELATLEVQGLSPDGRFVLAGGAAHAAWYHVHLRIDLQTGAAEQLSGIDRAFTPELVKPYLMALQGQGRFWRSYGEHGRDQRVLDLATGGWTPTDYDWQRNEPVLPEPLRTQVLTELRERSQLRAPGGLRVWVEGTTVCFAEADGSVTRQDVPQLAGGSLYATGHGFLVFGAGRKNHVFDLTQRRLLSDPAGRGSAFAVRGALVFAHARQQFLQWSQRDAGGELRRLDLLNPCRVFGLFDDDHLLVASWPGREGAGGKLFLYRPADRSVTELPLPEGVPAHAAIENTWPLGQRGSLLARDPAGCIWLEAVTAGRRDFLRVDTADGVVTRAIPGEGSEGEPRQLLGWPDPRSALVRQGARLVSIDVPTGEQTVLFPRP